MSIKDKINKIKYIRSHPNEVYLVNRFSDVVLFKHKQYPYSSFYIKDGEIMFEIENDKVFINREIFWNEIVKIIILPIGTRNGIEIEKEVNKYFIKYYSKDLCSFTRYREYKSWKHVLRTINSNKRKVDYVG